MSNALPMSNRVKMTEFDGFLTKFVKLFCYFQKSGPIKFLVLDPGGLLETLSCFSTGRTLFNRILTFKIENFGV